MKTVKRALQRLHFVRLLKKAGLSRQPLTMTDRGLMESILTSGITVCYGNTTLAERKSLQRVMKTAERIIGYDFPSMGTIYTQRCRRRAQSTGCPGTIKQEIHLLSILLGLLYCFKLDAYSFRSLTIYIYIYTLKAREIFRNCQSREEINKIAHQIIIKRTFLRILMIIIHQMRLY